MSTFFYLDSNYRRDQTESPSSFRVFPDQTANWPLNARTINVVQPTIYNQSLDFLSKTALLDLFIFYDGVISEPFVKVIFYNIEYNDNFSINTLDDQTDVKFIARQYKEYTDGWTRYTSEMKQLMRLKRKGTFVFKILDKDNNIVNVGQQGRITVLFSATPFIQGYRPEQVRNV